MLILFRLILSSAFVWLLWSASTEASANLSADVLNAGRFALALIVGFAAALTWAPVLGEEIAGPVTGLMTDGSVADINLRLVRWAKNCQGRGWRRLALLLAFAEGVRRPKLPASFVIGLKCARPGSWLELAFAREVWRFNNVANCVRAYDILVLHHDRRPRAHPVPEVNLALLAHTRPGPPAAEILPLPAAPPPPPLERNSRIRLFAGAPEVTPAEPPVKPDQPAWAMFVLLHRLMKAGVLGLWLAGAWWLWAKREAARPLVDYYQVWEAAGYREPEPLPRIKGAVTRAVSDTSVYLRDERGRVWAVGLTGFFGVEAGTRDPLRRRLAADSRTNLQSLAGQPVELAFTQTNANRTALGYLYVGTNEFGLADEFVAAGRWRAAPTGTRPLPLKEQVRLRVSERMARFSQRGLWAGDPADTGP